MILAAGMVGDIGNSSAAYARAYYDVLRLDIVTVNPLMGLDSVQPFLRAGKVVVIPVSFAWGLELAESVIDWTYRLSLEHPPGMVRIEMSVDCCWLGDTTRVQLAALSTEPGPWRGEVG